MFSVYLLMSNGGCCVVLPVAITLKFPLLSEFKCFFHILLFYLYLNIAFCLLYNLSHANSPMNLSCCFPLYVSLVSLMLCVCTSVGDTWAGGLTRRGSFSSDCCPTEVQRTCMIVWERMYVIASCQPNIFVLRGWGGSHTYSSINFFLLVTFLFVILFTWNVYSYYRVSYSTQKRGDFPSLTTGSPPPPPRMIPRFKWI